MTDNIHTAINKVMQEVGYVQKEKAGGLPYSFAGEAALIKALRPSMLEHGITMFQSGKPLATSEVYTNKNGTVMNRVMINTKYTFTHAPSLTAIDVYSTGEGTDAGDKATNKASTGAFKYALRQTFIIETGDDPDKQPSKEQERGPKKQASPDAGPVGALGVFGGLFSNQLTLHISRFGEEEGFALEKLAINLIVDA